MATTLTVATVVMVVSLGDYLELEGSEYEVQRMMMTTKWRKDLAGLTDCTWSSTDDWASDDYGEWSLLNPLTFLYS